MRTERWKLNEKRRWRKKGWVGRGGSDSGMREGCGEGKGGGE